MENHKFWSDEIWLDDGEYSLEEFTKKMKALLDSAKRIGVVDPKIHCSTYEREGRNGRDIQEPTIEYGGWIPLTDAEIAAKLKREQDERERQEKSEQEKAQRKLEKDLRDLKRLADEYGIELPQDSAARLIR